MIGCGSGLAHIRNSIVNSQYDSGSHQPTPAQAATVALRSLTQSLPLAACPSTLNSVKERGFHGALRSQLLVTPSRHAGVPRLRDKGESPLTPQLRKGAWLQRSFTLSTN